MPKYFALFIISIMVFAIAAYSEAHVIGEDSRTTNGSFPVTPQYYNSSLQANVAKNNLVHLKCKNRNKEFNQNTTSAFFIDASEYAIEKKLQGDFKNCKNRVLVTVAHYLNDRGGIQNLQCSVIESFSSNRKNKAVGARVIRIISGSENTSKEFFESPNVPSQYKLDFAILEIEPLRNQITPTKHNLKICTIGSGDFSRNERICNHQFKDDVILPHLSRNQIASEAQAKGWNYKQKTSSGKCCIKETNLNNHISHTCDMDFRASGAPLLNIRGTDIPCALGVQSAQNANTQHPRNYAVSLANNVDFDRKMSLFLSQSTCKM